MGLIWAGGAPAQGRGKPGQFRDISSPPPEPGGEMGRGVARWHIPISAPIRRPRREVGVAGAAVDLGVPRSVERRPPHLPSTTAGTSPGTVLRMR
ncbi:hypothetical protein P7K49_027859, partial [Saguinus oedipus]